MARDRKGNKLHVGDLVMIPGVLRGIDAHDTYINCAIETLEGRHPDGKTDMLQMNAAQIELQRQLGTSDVDIDVAKAMSDSGVLERTTTPPPPNKSAGSYPELDDPEDVHG